MIGHIAKEPRGITHDADDGQNPEDEVEKLIEVEQREGEEIHLQNVTGYGEDSRCHDQRKVGRE